MAGAAVLAIAGFTALGSIFDYPKILKEPTAEILDRVPRSTRRPSPAGSSCSSSAPRCSRPLGDPARPHRRRTARPVDRRPRHRRRPPSRSIGLSRWVLLVPAQRRRHHPAHAADAHHASSCCTPGSARSSARPSATRSPPPSPSSSSRPSPAHRAALDELPRAMRPPRSSPPASSIPLGSRAPASPTSPATCCGASGSSPWRRAVAGERDAGGGGAHEGQHRLSRTLRTCWRSRCSAPSRSARDGRRRRRCRPARRRSCWCASRSRPGSLVRTERLVEDLWGDAAVHAAQHAAVEGRAAAPGARRPCARRRHERRRYRLAVEPGVVDALAVLDDAVAAARTPRRRRSDARRRAAPRRRLRRSAASCCPRPATGPPRIGPGSSEARLALVETLFAARLRLGRRGVIGELEAAVAAHPYQERLWELLITALYRAGRQADALAAYQRVRARARRRARARPGPRAAASSSSRSSCTTTRRSAAPAPRGQPAVAVGRARRPRRRRSTRSVGAARDRTPRRDRRAGRGRQDRRSRSRSAKTLRRRRAASGWPGSRPRRRPTRSLDTVIAALDVTGGEAALLERLGATPAVVILDNCEHVVDAAADARRAPARRRARRCGSCARARSRSTSTARPSSSSRRSRSPTPSSCSPAGRRARAGDAGERRTTCAARSTGCRSRSSSPRRARGRCRSRRSPAGSTIASACCATRPAASRNAAAR